MLILTLTNAVANWWFGIAVTISRRRQRARWHAVMKLQRRP
jgi:hypothetical protein